MANKFTAEMLEEFAQARNKDKTKLEVKYSDFLKIQNIQQTDIPEAKKYVADQLTRIDGLKDESGKPLADDAKKPLKAEWERLQTAINELESSWKAGKLQIEKHKDENHAAVVEKTRKQLTELFGVPSPSAAVAEMAEISPDQLIKDLGTKLNAYGVRSNLSIAITRTWIATKWGFPTEWPITRSELIRVTAYRNEPGTNISLDQINPPIIIDKISLLNGGSILGSLKTSDQLFQEIVAKIESGLKPTPQATIGAVVPATHNWSISTSGQPNARKPGQEEGSRRNNDKPQGSIDEKNKAFLEKNKARFDAVLKKLSESTEATKKGLGDVLDNYMKKTNQDTAEALQNWINTAWKTIDVDKKVGGLTLGALESIAGIDSPTQTIPWWRTPTEGTTRPSNPNWQGRDPRGAFRWDRTEEAISSSPLNDSQVAFSREWGRILLNAKDKNGSIVQKLYYEDVLKLSWKKEMPEAMKKELNELILLSTIADIWVQSTSKDMDSMAFGSFRADGKKKTQAAINDLTNYINWLSKEIQSGKSIRPELGRAVEKFKKINESTGLIHIPMYENDLDKALEVVFSNSADPVTKKQSKILQILSSKFNSTGTQAVKDTAMNEVIKMKEFADLQKNLQDKKFMNEFTDGDSKTWKDKLIQQFWLPEWKAYDLAKLVRDTRKELESRTDEIRSALTAKWASQETIRTQVDWAKSHSIQLVMSQYIVNERVDNIKNSDAVDAYKVAKSDLSFNRYVEMAVQAAISLVPMWVWLGVGRLALAGASRVGARVAPGVANGTVRMSGLTRFAWASAVEGIGFYEGFNLTNNLLRNQDTENQLGGAFEWWNDPKEIIKSVAMVGVIKWMWLIPGQRIDQSLIKNPTFIKNLALEIGKVAGISTLVVGTSQSIEALFGEGFNPTPEEFAQAVVMTALFRNIWWKSKKNEPQLSEWYELTTITSRKWINTVRKAQKADPNYKPEIVGPDGKVYLVDSIKWPNWRETIALSDKVNWVESKISASELTSGKYRTLAKNDSNGVKDDTGKVEKTEGAKEWDKTTKEWEKTKIGTKVEDSIEQIINKIARNKLSKDEKSVINTLESSTKNIETLDLKTLKEARSKINDIAGDYFLSWKIRESSPVVKWWQSVLEKLDTMIAIKSPKYNFPSLAEARKWISENPKKVSAWIIVIVAGVTYSVIQNTKNEVTIKPLSTEDKGQSLNGATWDRWASIGTALNWSANDRSVNVDSREAQVD